MLRFWNGLVLVGDSALYCWLAQSIQEGELLCLNSIRIYLDCFVKS